MGVKNILFVWDRAFVFALGALLFLGALPSIALAQKKAEDLIDGSWVGEIQIDGQEIKLVFELKQIPSGLIEGTIMVPIMGPTPMPITNARISGRNLSIQVDKIGAYQGKVSLKSGRATGDWIGKEGNKIPMDLERLEGKSSIFKRPQTPKEPFPYQVKQVQFPNKPGNNVLAGTLTLPKAMRAVSAVILVSDSGPQDRDATQHGHKPFAVLADYLAKKGIASLRYDDRGIGKSTGTYAYGTTMDFATDAFAAVDFLKTQKEINPAAIGIIGHGEGGLIAPIVATKRDDLAFLVLLAAPGLRGDQTLLVQSDAIGRASGLDENILKMSRRLLDSFYKVLTQTPPDVAKAQKVYGEFEKMMEAYPQKEKEKLGHMQQFLGSQLQRFQQLENNNGQMRSPWFASYLAYDPSTALNKVKCPVYALNGDRDLEILADIHLPAIKRHLSVGGNKKVLTEKLSNLNHRFQKAEKGFPNEYSKIEVTFEVSAMKKIASWISRVAQR